MLEANIRWALRNGSEGLRGTLAVVSGPSGHIELGGGETEEEAEGGDDGRGLHFGLKVDSSGLNVEKGGGGLLKWKE